MRNLPVLAKHTAAVLVLAIGVVAQNTLPRDDDGWTIFTPSEDTRIAYVSSSSGNDTDARTYGKDDPEIGDDPFLPTGEIAPFATIAAAFDSVNDGAPDWVLLKKGDVWHESLKSKDGRSDDEPFLVASYGNASARPLLETGNNTGLQVCCKGFRHRAIAGIHLYANGKDPQSSDYQSGESGNGFRFFTGREHPGHGVLIENCKVDFYRNNISFQTQGENLIEDVVVRRNVITNAYSSSSHSQGFYAHSASILLEENVFDHNGWLIHAEGNQKDSGGATIFNHNTYFGDCRNTTFRNNLFLRSSSIQNKWRADQPGGARNITMDNNLYVEGEVGLSVGGNTDSAYRFINITIQKNVLLEIGRDQPTMRNLSWYLGATDWDSGSIEGNLFLRQRKKILGNTHAIKIGGKTGRHISVRNNIIHGLYSSNRKSLVSLGDGKEHVAFENNIVQRPFFEGPLVSANEPFSGYTVSGNHYFSKIAESEWFRIEKEAKSLSDWQTLTGETNAEDSLVDFVDTTRSIETYMESIAMTPTFESFIEEACKQSKDNWRPEFTAPVINDWFREGFTPKGESRIQSERVIRIRNRERSGVKAYYTLDGRKVGMENYLHAPLFRSQNRVLIRVDANGKRHLVTNVK